MAKSRFALFITFFAAISAWAWASTPPPNLDKALSAQYEILRARANDSVAHNDLGNLLVVANRLDEAEAAYRRALDLDGTSSDVRYNLGLLLHQQGRLDDARDELAALIELDPFHAWGHYHLGTVFLDAGNRKDSLEYYARAFALDPTLSFARHNPHVIDNPHATEALLMSSRYERPVANRMARRYGEADRIADLMLEEAERAAAAAAAEEEADSSTDSASESEGENGEEWIDVGEEESGEAPRPFRNRAAFDDEDDLPRLAPEDEARSRQLTNEDLDSSGSNRGSARAAGGFYRPPARSTDGRGRSASDGRSSGEASVGADRPTLRGAQDRVRNDRSRGTRRGATNPGVAAPRASAGETGTPSTRSVRQRFRPGSGSTARLDLELLPPDSGEGPSRS